MDGLDGKVYLERIAPDGSITKISVSRTVFAKMLLDRLEHAISLGDRSSEAPRRSMGTGGDAPHQFYTRLVNDLAIYSIGLAKRDRTLARLQAALDQYRRQPATFACTLVPRRAPGAPRAGCS